MINYKYKSLIKKDDHITKISRRTYHERNKYKEDDVVFSQVEFKNQPKV